MENQDLITTDLATVTTLVTLGYAIKEMRKTGPGRTSFTFADEGAITSILNRYWAHDLQVDARNFFENLKMIKTRISQLNNSTNQK